MNELRQTGRFILLERLVEWLNDNKPVDTIIVFGMSSLGVLTFSWALQHFFGWIAVVVLAAIGIVGGAVYLVLFVLMWLLGDFDR